MPRMNARDDDDYCINCGAKNTVLDSICCTCSWNNAEHRPATTEEMLPVIEKLDKSNAALEKFLADLDD